MILNKSNFYKSFNSDLNQFLFNQEIISNKAQGRDQKVKEIIEEFTNYIFDKKDINSFYQSNSLYKSDNTTQSKLTNELLVNFFKQYDYQIDYFYKVYYTYIIGGTSFYNSLFPLGTVKFNEIIAKNIRFHHECYTNFHLSLNYRAVFEEFFTIVSHELNNKVSFDELKDEIKRLELIIDVSEDFYFLKQCVIKLKKINCLNRTLTEIMLSRAQIKLDKTIKRESLLMELKGLLGKWFENFDVSDFELIIQLDQKTIDRLKDEPLRLKCDYSVRHFFYLLFLLKKYGYCRESKIKEILSESILVHGLEYNIRYSDFSNTKFKIKDENINTIITNNINTKSKSMKGLIGFLRFV